MSIYKDNLAEKADIGVPEPLLCSGYGAYHSTNHATKPRGYVGVTVSEIEAMADNPPSVLKDQAQWCVFSTLKSREHKAQREQGEFYALWADIDEPDGLTFDEVFSRASEVIRGNFFAYTSRSATEQQQKLRLIVPLDKPVSGAMFVKLQRILNNKLEAAGVTPDRVTERAAQLCYLPNKGEFYKSDKLDFIGAFSAEAWNTELAEEEARERAAEQALQAQREQARLKAQQRMESGCKSPIDAFNEEFSIQLMLDTYGYLKKGKRFISPNSSSGVPGVSITGDGRKILSTHDSDSNIGRPTSNGSMGDSFDLFVYYEHGGDRDAAIKAAGAMFTTKDGQSLTQANQRAYAEARSAQETMQAFDVLEDEAPVFEDEAQAVDLFSNLELPIFPLDLLPQTIARFAADQGELMGVDPAAIGMVGVAMAAAAIDDRIEIQPKRYDPTWREQARLWHAVIGDPSTKKTPALNKAAGPLRKIDHEWREASAKATAEWQAQCEALSKGDTKPPKPEQRRLILQDATVEKLGLILSEARPRGILSLQDELTSWLASHDAYRAGTGKDKAAWLEAYNGGPKSIDRVMRGSNFVQNWSVCVVGGIQPSVVNEYAKSANHDGLLQRFMLLYAREASAGQDRMPDMDAKRNYEDMLRHLAGLEPNATVVQLSEDAHKVREALDDKLLRTVRSHPNKFLTAALGKWNGLFARLLLTFHCIECADWQEYPTSVHVSGDTATRVARLMWEVLLPHAVRFYEGMDATQDSSRDLAALILARGWERFTVKRDLAINWKRSRSMKPWEMDETLDRLEAFGWIQPEPYRGVNERGKPKAYIVNKGVHRRFTAQAERERERRKEITAMMRELSPND